MTNLKLNQFIDISRWKESTRGIRNIEIFQIKQKYVYALEDFIEAKVSSISQAQKEKIQFFLRTFLNFGRSFSDLVKLSIAF